MTKTVAEILQLENDNEYLSIANFDDKIYVPALRHKVTEIILTNEEFYFAVLSSAHANQFSYVLVDNEEPYCTGFGIKLTCG